MIACNTVTLLELAQADTCLHRAGRHAWAGPCPLPGCGGAGRDRFTVFDSDRFSCRQCGGRGDRIDYVRAVRGLSFLEACRVAGVAPSAPRAGRRRVHRFHEEPELEPSAAWRVAVAGLLPRAQVDLMGAPAVAPLPAAAPARRHLLERGLSEDTIRVAGLGFVGGARYWWRTEGLHIGAAAIIIPWRFGGQLWMAKLRLLYPGRGPKYLPLVWTDPARADLHPCGQAHLYGAGTLEGHRDVFLCEGELDALLLWQEAGDLVATATIGSCTAPLSRRAARLLEGRRVFVAYDSDDAGRRGAARLLEGHPAWRAVTVPRENDITDFHRAGGRLRDWVRYEIARAGARPLTSSKEGLS